jgi:NadR type nicotinamide-nucleotide adenylyltransferase
MKKILVTGPESSGKSALCQQLAASLPAADWIPEYARAYLEGIGRPYVQEDLLHIARGQCQSEDMYPHSDKHWLFCDTGPEVVYVWSMVKYGMADPWIEAAVTDRRYDFYLLCYPDLPWEEDPLREAPSPAERLRLFQQYELLLRRLQRPFAVVREAGAERVRNALQALRTHTV